MNYLFEDTNSIIDGVGFSHFDMLHITWLVAFVVFAVVMSIHYKKSDVTQREKIRKYVALSIILNEIFKTVVLLIGGHYTVEYLPFHLCSINVFTIAYHVYKPNKNLDNFLYSVCLPGAVAALVAPSWVKLPLANFMHLHSFTFHILLATYPIMLVVGKDIQPNIKEFPKCLLFTCILAIPVYIFNLTFDTNFMFLMYADPGNPLYLFKQWFGHHLLGVPLIEAVVLLLLYTPFHIHYKKRTSL